MRIWAYTLCTCFHTCFHTSHAARFVILGWLVVYVVVVETYIAPLLGVDPPAWVPFVFMSGSGDARGHASQLRRRCLVPRFTLQRHLPHYLAHTNAMSEGLTHPSTHTPTHTKKHTQKHKHPHTHSLPRITPRIRYGYERSDLGSHNKTNPTTNSKVERNTRCWTAVPCISTLTVSDSRRRTPERYEPPRVEVAPLVKIYV
jgi:hypothetical protein